MIITYAAAVFCFPWWKFQLYTVLCILGSAGIKQVRKQIFSGRLNIHAFHNRNIAVFTFLFCRSVCSDVGVLVLSNAGIVAGQC